MTYRIEATLSPDPEDDAADFRADIVFAFVPGAPPRISDIDGGDPGWPPEIDILDVSPFGVVAPMDPKALDKLADDWLHKGGGYDICCRHVEERKGTWE